MQTSNFAFDVQYILGLESTCLDGLWMVGWWWVAGLAKKYSPLSPAKAGVVAELGNIGFLEDQMCLWKPKVILAWVCNKRQAYIYLCMCQKFCD